MDYGKDSYTTSTSIQAYLHRTLSANELTVLGFVIPAVSRWIDRALGSCFDNLDQNNPSNFTTRYFNGGVREINIHPCQQIVSVQAINPYDMSVWYTYSTPLEYTQEPFNLPVKTSLRLRLNEFTGNDLNWPSGGNPESIAVKALFTEYDYVRGGYPQDIIMLANHISAVWLQNNRNSTVMTRSSIEGYEMQKNLNNLNDILATDPMVQRIIESRQEIWLEEM